MQRIKGRSSRRIQIKVPDLGKRYWGRRNWPRGYFSATSGNITNDVIRQCLKLHSTKLCLWCQSAALHSTLVSLLRVVLTAYASF
jgi:hypothetical protein